MDLAFLRRGFSGESAARLEYGVLAAALQGVQASSAAARAEALAEPSHREANIPIADILIAAPGWRDAVLAQRGCFNSVQAERFGKAVAMQMTEEFTFAF
jgi:hypothetical protein